jgi:hypothetical protein
MKAAKNPASGQATPADGIPEAVSKPEVEAFRAATVRERVPLGFDWIQRGSAAYARGSDYPVDLRLKMTPAGQGAGFKCAVQRRGTGIPMPGIGSLPLPKPGFLGVD